MQEFCLRCPPSAMRSAPANREGTRLADLRRGLVARQFPAYKCREVLDHLEGRSSAEITRHHKLLSIRVSIPRLDRALEQGVGKYDVPGQHAGQRTDGVECRDVIGRAIARVEKLPRVT